MRLHSIRLEYWRGVASREIEFDEGVTLIEGPNEIGKSSLVEALHTLINEYDSSAKQSIKAVQPVGKDVGSTVSAEISTGKYRFSYAKTFNKNRKTELSILAPRSEQLAGRDAHDRVEQMLAETIDPHLWQALLVDQGEKVSQADLSGSAGLSAALDEAAGGSGADQEDGALFDAAQAEYDRYFTPTGRSRFADEERAVEAARAERDKARAALNAIGESAEDHERLAAAVHRLTRALPELKKDAEKFEKKWQAISALNSELSLKQKDFDAATASLQQVNAEFQARRTLIDDIARAAEQIREQEKKLEPHQEAIATLAEQAAKAQSALAELKHYRRRASAAAEIARADARYLRELDELQRLITLLAELAKTASGIESAAAIVAKIKVDENAIDNLQGLENDIGLLERQRDLAATEVVISAESELGVTIGGESIGLAAEESLKRRITARTELHLPGVARVCIDPPATVTDLESELREKQGSLANLMKQLGVIDRNDARRQLVEKTSANSDLQIGKRRQQDLLGTSILAELEQAKAHLEVATATYAKNRVAEPPLAASVPAADALVESVTAEVETAEAKITDAENSADECRMALQNAEVSVRELTDNLVGVKATLQDKEARLANQRADKDDPALSAEVAAAKSIVEESRRAVAETTSRLGQLNPDTIGAHRDNARASAERAESELAAARTELAVIEDRLHRARATGLFEEADLAESQLEEVSDRYRATQRRANAAERLWSTLNTHRTAARQSYVRPLKEATERLGGIVFGDDFSISLNDDWSIESRTLNGVTLPFDVLSVGAKEQLGLLVRLAAARIVSTQGGVPLIIDDALGFSDPSRLKGMGAALSAAGKDSQVIILTCDPGRFSSLGHAAVRRL